MNDFFEPLTKEIENFDISINEQELLDLMKIRKRWSLEYHNGQPSVEIINNVGNKSNVDIFQIDSYLDYDKWKSYYDLGYTTIISNVLDLTEELRNLSDFTNKRLGSRVNANFYFSRPGQKPSFDPHVHSYNVIAKQIYGHTDWIRGDERITMKPGQAIWIPRHMKHAVVAKDEPRLSLTMGIY
mgnify:CR=1 FL=1